MRFAVLGPLAVLRDDHEPTIVPGAKERLLLAVLTAAAPGAVSTDRLLETVWDGDPPLTARKSLQAHMVRLRSALEPDRPKGSSGRYVVRRGPGYALSVERVAIDALLFSDLTTRGRAQLASGDAAGALKQLTEAVGLWRGEPYADWPDAPFADVERRRLAEVRSATIEGLLEARLGLGQHAEVVPELERLVAEEPLRETWWGLLMLALYRGGRQADALAAGRRARALLADELGTDPGPGLRAVETAILTQDPSLDLPQQRTVEPTAPSDPGTRARPGETRVGGCPYKGLAAYQPADAALFHGRQRLVSALVSRLVDVPLLVVSGPSGAGKSSVVRAGLVPSLAGGALPGSHTWRPLIVSPGLRPVDAIATLTGESPPEATVLLVCDQFEQLWAPGTDEAERGAFLDTVLGLLDDGVVARCVAVVRGDHLGRLAEHAEWTERIGGAIVLVPPMTDPELRDVVIQPARAAGLDVEPELLDVVVADVLGQAGALPLLSTALVSTWERRRDDRLTVAGYLAAGGVEGALTRTAEAAYAALDDRGRDVAHQLMVRLADSEEGAVLVRRAVPLTELHLHGELGSARRAVVEAFVARRLLAVDDERLEVAHEALLTSWPRLARWLDEDAARRAVRRHVAPAALQWDRAGRPADELYRGARLAPALDWAAAPGSDPTPLERDFLEASRAHADAELHAARERAEREAAGRRRTRRLAAGLATLLVVALVATGLAVAFQRRADHRAAEADAATTVADADRLAALSTTAGSLDVSMLLAAEAARLAETPETQDGLLAALARQPHAIRSVSIRGRGFVAGLAGAGRVLFVAAGDRVVAWDVASGESPRTALRPPARETANWEAFDASPTEALVVIAGNDRVAGRVDVDPWVRVNAADGSRRLWLENGELQGTLVETAFSADGRRLLVLLSEPSSRGGRGWDWSVQEVDLADGAVRATGVEGRFPGSDGPVDGLFADDASAVTVWPEGSPVGAATIDLGAGRQGKATPLVLDRRTAPFTHFLPLPTGTAQLWEDGAVTLYDHRGRAVQVLDAHEEPVGDVLVSPDGAWAATVGDGGRVVLWDIDPSTGRWSKSEELVGHNGDVTNVEVDPSGQTLFTLSWDATVIAWDVSRDAGFGSSYPALAGRWVSNRPQTVEPGRLLVAPTRPNSRSGADNREPAPDTSSVAATFLDPATGRTVDQVVVGDTLEGIQFGSSVAVSPDRRMVAVTSGLATTVLDTRTREVLGTVVLPPKGTLGFDDKPLAAEPVWCAGWTPDGSRLLIGAEGLVTVNGDVRDAGIVVVDPATWEVERRVDLGAAPQAIETSPNGRLMAVAMNAAEVQILDAGTLEHLRTVRLGAEDDFPWDLSFSPDGRRLAFGGSLRRLHIVDTTTWRPVNEPVEVHDGDLIQVEWMPDGRTVVTSGYDGTVSLFDVRRGLVRAVPLPSSSERGNGRTYLIADIPGELIAIRGDLTGRRYPMRPSRWLAEACAVAGRDLTRAEWDRYLPDRTYRRTCTPLF